MKEKCIHICTYLLGECNVFIGTNPINVKPTLSNILGDSWNYMPPILFPSSAKRMVTQMLVIEKLNGRRDFILRDFVCDIMHPNKELLVQSKLHKLKNKMWECVQD